MAGPRAFLIDGTAFCYRAFYAIRALSTVDGRPTNAVYGFAMMLGSLREKEQPDYLAVAFDVGKPTFRHRRFQAYKMQRKPMPDPLISQIPIVKTMLAAYRIPVFEREGYEAEDVLATIAKQIAKDGTETFLVTGDKDALQLVNSHVKVYNPHQDDGAVLDAAAVRARYGVGPERMVDLMALIGDEIDNIPGVPGIGEKTATQLLQRFGSLEALYRHLDDIENASKRQSLAAARDQVELSKELVRVHTDVPLEVSREDLKVQEPDWRSLRALFRDLEFKRLLRAIESRAPAASSAGPLTHAVRAEEDLEAFVSTVHGRRSNVAALMSWFAQDADPAIRPRQRTVAGAPAAVLRRAGGRDVAPHGASSLVPQAVPVGLHRSPHALLAIALGPDEAWVVPLTRQTRQSPAGQRLAAWLADPTAPKVSHDGKAAKRVLKRLGIEVNGLIGDTMLAAYLLNPARTSQPLTDLSDEYLDEPLSPLPALEGASSELWEGAESVAPFGRSACAVIRLHEALQRKLESHGLATLYTELELPLLAVLHEMETIGIAVDVPYLKRLQASMDAELERLSQEIFRLAGSTFNLNSPRQLAQVLFEQLKLPVVKRNKTGPSTDSDVLQQLAAHHPLPAQLMHYRELSKLVSTYVVALPELADPATGRIHTSFNQAATATGRLSSSEPNLQNIPVKTELGRSIRKAFIPGMPDGRLVAADYSQIELRILAHLSGDEQLIEAFRNDRDIHRFTASLIYGCPESDVRPEQRSAMKAVNYGILYGMTSHGLSKALGLSFEESQAFIDAYFARYPGVRRYLDKQIAQAKRDGFVQTLLGRRRYIPEVNSPDMMIRQFGERMAVNAPIQGTAADVIKRAMVQLAGRLEAAGLTGRMVLQVHDELIFETNPAELSRLAPIVRDVMEGAITLRVPLTVTMKSGPNWLDLAPL